MCEKCAALADSLRILAQRIEPVGGDELRHFLIGIQVEDHLGLWYVTMTQPIPDHERLNALLQERGGVIPENETWFTAGHGTGFEHVAEFDNAATASSKRALTTSRMQIAT